ncbi:MAG: short-chain dehydrogenase/reductase [Pseudolabrys sp.]
MDLQITGLTALITGGSRGIGYAVAQSLAGEGCNLHLASRTTADLDSARSRLLQRYNVQVTCHTADLGQRGSSEQLAKECGAIDILVNNAGSIPRGELTDTTDSTWRSAWDLKVYGFINLSREVYRSMQARGSGVIINIIGTAGEQPTYNYIIGSAGNAALMGFSRALGSRSPDHGIRVVGLNPGSTETDRQRVRWEARAKDQLGDSSRWRELVKNAPFGRLGKPEEVGDVVAFLASPRAGYISGTVITVDGGRAARHQGG